MMARTLSLVSAGGTSNSDHAIPEWTGPKTRPEDPGDACVYDAREEMLRELRARLEVRRKSLDCE